MPSLLGAGLALGLCLTGGIADAAQAPTGTIRVEVVEAARPVAGATVSAGGQSAATDASGVATLTLPPGPVSVTATKDGYEPATARVEVVAGAERAVRLVLTPKTTEQDQATVVASTRTGRRIDEQAVPVEVLGRGDDRTDDVDVARQHREVARQDAAAARADHVAGAGPDDAAHPGACAASTRGCSPTACRSTSIIRAGSRPCRFRRWISPRSKSSREARRRSSARTPCPARSTCCRAGRQRAEPRDPVQPVHAGRDGWRVLDLVAADRILEPHAPRQRA